MSKRASDGVDKPKSKNRAMAKVRFGRPSFMPMMKAKGIKSPFDEAGFFVLHGKEIRAWVAIFRVNFSKS